MLVRRTFRPLDLYSAGGFDRTFQQLVDGFYSSTARRAPSVQATTTDGTLTLTVDLPGVPAEAVGVEVSGRTLTLRAEHDGLSWERSTGLGTQYDLDNVSAAYADGRLTVTVPAAPAPAARKIAVTVGAPAAAPRAVEAADVTETSEVPAVGEAVQMPGSPEPATTTVTSEVTES